MFRINTRLFGIGLTLFPLVSVYFVVFDLYIFLVHFCHSGGL